MAHFSTERGKIITKVILKQNIARSSLELKAKTFLLHEVQV